MVPLVPLASPFLICPVLLVRAIASIKAIRSASEGARLWVETTTWRGEPVPLARPLETLRNHPEVIDALRRGAMLTSVPLITDTGSNVPHQPRS